MHLKLRASNSEHQTQNIKHQKMSNPFKEKSSINISMKLCPSGFFWMGTDDFHLTEAWWASSKPKHQVHIPHDLLMGESLITQLQWELIMGWNPSDFRDNERLPVENITWYDALIFCNQLSKLEQLSPCFHLSSIEQNGHHTIKAKVEWDQRANGYRLPTEAEWEYVAKAGKELIYSGSSEIDEVGWYHGNAGREGLSEDLWLELDQNWDQYEEKLIKNQNRTHMINRKKANAWGIYDMTGNVWEWCMDRYDADIYQETNNLNMIRWDENHCERIVRGGSFWYPAKDCRLDRRMWQSADKIADDIGFRILRQIC